jgi:uncharacterized protein (TIGR00251 family)
MADAVLISVRVTPRSGRDELQGWQDGALRVRLRAPPVEGRANEALVRLLADRLGVAPSHIEVVSGGTARTKRLRIEGLTEGEVRARLTAS